MRRGWIKTTASFLAVLMLITSLPMESFAREEISTAAEEIEEEAGSAAEEVVEETDFAAEKIEEETENEQSMEETDAVAEKVEEKTDSLEEAEEEELKRLKEEHCRQMMEEHEAEKEAELKEWEEKHRTVKKTAEKEETITVQSSDSFTPRTTCPDTTDSHYFSTENPFYPTYAPTPGTLDALGNCTWYAWGRAYEILGTKPQLSTGNAGNWYSYNSSKGYYEYSSNAPRVGAIACWSNHVAVVEKVNSDGTIMISESSYKVNGVTDGIRFQTRDHLSGASPYNYGDTFYGYIYLGKFGGNIYSGNYKGLDWKVTKDGVLTISGTATEEFSESFEWKDYLSAYNDVNVKKIIVDITGENIYSMSHWFFNFVNVTSIVFKNVDTKNVTSMVDMFYDCESLQELDVSGFDTSKVTDMHGMFAFCESLQELDVSGFDTSKVTCMGWMFCWCESLQELDVSGFDTSKVTDMGDMFVFCESLQELDVSGFDTSKVTCMGWMFCWCESLQELDVSGFDTSKVTDMHDMFCDCESLQELDVSGFDTSKVTDMGGMFYDCESLQELDVSGFDTSKVTDMGDMFVFCESLQELDVSGFDTSKVTCMGWMFGWCESLQELDVSGFDTSKVTDMGGMFCWCESLQELDVSGFDTSKVTDMHDMFCDCESLQELDVSGFDTSKVTDMGGMFCWCESLRELDLSSFDLSAIANEDSEYGMLYGVNNLQQIKTPRNVGYSEVFYTGEYISGKGYQEEPFSMYDASGKEYTELPQNLSESITLYRNLEDIPEDLGITLDEGTTVPSGEVWVKVLSPSKKPIKNAVVEYNGLCVNTEENGIAKLGSYVKGMPLVIKADNYADRVVENLQCKSSGYYTFIMNKGLKSVIFTLNGRDVDLLSESKTIDLINKNTVFDLTVKTADPEISKMVLYSGDRRVAESTDGKFRNLCYSSFQKEKSVYLKAYSSAGKLLDQRKLNLTVEQSETIPSSVSMGNGITITLGKDVPILGGTQLEISLDSLPVTVSETNGKLKVLLGYEFGEFSLKEEDCFEKLKSLNTDTYSQFLKELRSGEKYEYQTSEIKYKNKINGYLETPQGALGTSLTGKLYYEGTVTYKKERQMSVAAVPVVLEISVEGKFTEGGGIEWTIKDGFAGSINIGGSIEVGLYAGVGFANLASAGIYGSAKLGVDWQWLPIEEQKFNEIYVEGKVGLQVKVLGKSIGKITLLNGKYYFIKNDTSHSTLQTAAGTDSAAQAFSIDYDTVYPNVFTGSGFQAWNDCGAVLYGNLTEETLQASVCADIDPQIVKTEDGLVMLSYLTNSTERAAGNQSMLVYSLYDEETDTWQSPAAVYDDGTADFCPDFYADGQDIYAVWQDADSALAEDLTLNQIAERLKLTVAKYNRESGAFETLGTIEDDLHLLMQQPQIAVKDGSLKVFWHENAADNVLGLSGENVFYCAELMDAEKGISELSADEKGAESVSENTAGNPTDEEPEEEEPSEEAPADEGEPAGEEAPADEEEPTDEETPADEEEPTDKGEPTDEEEPADEGEPADEEESAKEEVSAEEESANEGEAEAENKGSQWRVYVSENDVMPEEQPSEEAEENTDSEENESEEDTDSEENESKEDTDSEENESKEESDSEENESKEESDSEENAEEEKAAQGEETEENEAEDAESAAKWQITRIGATSEAVLSSDAGCSQGSLCFAAAAGTLDSDYNISSARILLASGGELQTIEEGSGTNVRFSELYGSPALTWFENGDIHYLDAQGRSAELFGEARLSGVDYLLSSDSAGKPTVIYAQSGNDRSELYQISYREGEGFLPAVCVSQQEQYIQNVDGFRQNNSFCLVYNKMTVENLEEQSNMLCTGVVQESILDAELQKVSAINYWSEDEGAQQLQTYVTIANAGTEPLSGLTLSLKDSDGAVLEEREIEETIAAGESVTLTEEYPMSLISAKGSYRFALQPLSGESRTDNNEAVIELGAAELTLETELIKAGAYELLQIGIRNYGLEESAGTLKVTDYDNGTEYYSTEFQAIGAGESIVYDCNIPPEAFGRRSAVNLRVEVIPTTAQEEDALLTQSLTVRAPEFTVCFQQEEGEPYYVSGVRYGTTVAFPENPKKEGCYFVGWYADEDTLYTEETKITGDVTLTARWQEEESVVPLAQCSVSAIADQYYTGKALKPAVTVKYGNQTLRSGKDYTVSFRNNKEQGTGTAEITGKGNYSGTLTRSFKIYYDLSKASAAKIAEKEYSGKELKPIPVLTYRNKKLNNGTDYTISYRGNKDAGTACITVTGKGKYRGSKEIFFKIKGISLSKMKFSKLKNQTYCGSALAAEVTVTDNAGKALVQGTDYQLVYQDNVKAGTAAVNVIGQGNYTGSKKLTYKILPAEMTEAEVTLPSEISYSSSAVTPSPEITWNGTSLKEKEDYTLSYKNNKKAGTATLTISGKGNFKGKRTETFVIKPLVLSEENGEIRAEIADMAYTGRELKPKVTVFCGDKKLGSKDYTISYRNNKELGEGYADITGKGNYTGTLTAAFRIVEKSRMISACEVQKLSVMTYDEEPLTPEVQVTDHGKLLEKDADYTLSYEKNDRAGTAVVIVHGIGNYAGVQRISFKITAKPIADKEGTLAEGIEIAPIEAVLYTGYEQKPEVAVTAGGRTLREGTDYTLKFKKNKNPGTAMVTIAGKGNYSGKTTRSFEIGAWDFDELTVSIPDQTFNGKALKPVPEFTLRGEQVTLKPGTVYSVSYTNNKNTGNAKAVLKGKGIYAKAAPVELGFYIDPLDIEEAVVSKVSNQTFRGSLVTPIPKVKVGKLKLKYNRDFTVSYVGNGKKGEAVMIISGKGNYVGICEAAFVIQ